MLRKFEITLERGSMIKESMNVNSRDEMRVLLQEPIRDLLYLATPPIVNDILLLFACFIGDGPP